MVKHMKLSLTNWSFSNLSLDEVGGIAKILGFEAIDLGYFYKCSLDKVKLLTEPESYGSEISAALPVDIANLFHVFGDDEVDRNLSLPSNPQNLADLKSALVFAKTIGAPSIFILPGMINSGQSRAEAMKVSAEALKPMVAAGQEAGVAVLIEPHVHSLLESPAVTQELLHAVPGLKLVLDPSHYTALGYRQEEIEVLAGEAGHVHLRQAKQGYLQTRMESGTINFPGFFGALRDAGYDGWLSIEFEDQDNINTLAEDVLSETVKMRDCFRSWSSSVG